MIPCWMAYAVITLGLGFVFWHNIRFGIMMCIGMGMLSLVAWFKREKSE
jgi:hypothetical protein